MQLFSRRHTMAFLDLSNKVNIRVKWDWLSTNCGPGKSITPSHVIRAVQYGCSSFSKFSESNFETSESLSLSECNGKGETLTSLVSICNFSTGSLKISFVMESNPVTSVAGMFTSLFSNGNIDSIKINWRAWVNPTLWISTIGIIIDLNGGAWCKKHS